jgi:NAD+ diphosphatase
MDHYQRSRHNLFTTSPLDRAEDHRRNAAWLAARLQAPGTRYTLVHKLKHLVTSRPPIQPVYLAPEELHALFDDLPSPTLLGLDGDRAYFSVDLPATPDALPESLARLGHFQELRQVATLLESTDAAIMAHARAMAYWHQRHRYCGDCGSPTKPRAGGYVRVCTNPDCGQLHFPRSDPAIIVLVESGDRALFGRKPNWPLGLYSTIAGFVEPGECIEQAVIREVREETGVRVGEIHYQSSQPWPFPSSLMLGFRATAADPTIQVDQNELQDAQWFTREQLRAGLLEKRLQIPNSISVSHRLIEGWFDEGELEPLREILQSL